MGTDRDIDYFYRGELPKDTILRVARVFEKYGDKKSIKAARDASLKFRSWRKGKDGKKEYRHHEASLGYHSPTVKELRTSGLASLSYHDPKQGFDEPSPDDYLWLDVTFYQREKDKMSRMTINTKAPEPSRTWRTLLFARICEELYYSTKPLIMTGMVLEYDEKEYAAIKQFKKTGELRDLLVRKKDKQGKVTRHLPGSTPLYLSQTAVEELHRSRFMLEPRYTERLKDGGMRVQMYEVAEWPATQARALSPQSRRWTNRCGGGGLIVGSMGGFLLGIIAVAVDKNVGPDAFTRALTAFIMGIILAFLLAIIVGLLGLLLGLLIDVVLER